MPNYSVVYLLFYKFKYFILFKVTRVIWEIGSALSTSHPAHHLFHE